MISVELDKKSDIPLYIQIRDHIIEEIEQGRLPIGEKLPTVSALAKSLKVTQATILRAFEDLSKEKYILSFVGRGTFVNDRSIEQRSPAFQPHTRSPLAPFDPEFALAARRLRMGIENSLDALQVLVDRPGIIHFTSGIPDPSIADGEVLKRCTEAALKKGQSLYQGYGEPMGMKELRSIIASRYRERGLDITGDNVMITGGSQQAVAILSQWALENRRKVIVESPCYMGITKAFGAIGHWVDSLAREESGPVAEKLTRFENPSLLYLCTKLHNPMGKDISQEKVSLVKAWAEETDSQIISDEIFEDLYFHGKNPPSFFNSFGEERCVVISSISKSFMCGMRIGWLIASEKKIRELWSLKRAIDIGSPTLMQAIALELFRSGEYDRHIKRAQEHYLVRRDALLTALKENMPDGVTWTIPDGGVHMWLELPPGYSSIALFLLAIERGVAITPGPKMDVDHRFIRGFKLSYGSVSETQITEGVESLADAVKELLKGSPSDPGLSGLGDF